MPPGDGDARKRHRVTTTAIAMELRRRIACNPGVPSGSFTPSANAPSPETTLPRGRSVPVPQADRDGSVQVPTPPSGARSRISAQPESSGVRPVARGCRPRKGAVNHVHMHYARRVQEREGSRRGTPHRRGRTGHVRRLRRDRIRSIGVRERMAVRSARLSELPAVDCDHARLLLSRELGMKRRRPPPVRFIRPSWNARRSTCDTCGAVEENDGRLLIRLRTCKPCIEEARDAHH